MENQIVVVHSLRMINEGHFFFRIGAPRDAKRNLYSCESLYQENVKQIGFERKGEKWIVRPIYDKKGSIEILEIDWTTQKMRVPEPHNGWDGLEDWTPFSIFKPEETYVMTYYPYNPCP